jgi:ATP-dependent Clp protease protease subunit
MLKYLLVQINNERFFMKFLVFTAVTTFLGFSGSVVYNNFTGNSIKNEVVTIASSNNSIITVNDSVTSDLRKVVKQNVDKSRTLYLFGEVGFVNTQFLIAQLQVLNAKSSSPIYLLIDSPGGSVLDGGQLVSAMEVSKAPIYTVCTRICASMAAVIHSYGTKRLATDRSILMYHPASGGAQGQVPNMLSQINAINNYLDRMVSHIVSRSKLSRADFDKKVAYEIWDEAEVATKEGFNDTIVSLDVPQIPLQRVTETIDLKADRLNDLRFEAPDNILYLWNITITPKKDNAKQN